MEVDPLKLADNIENGNCMDDEGRFLLNVWEDELIVKALRSYARPEAGVVSFTKAEAQELLRAFQFALQESAGSASAVDLDIENKLLVALGHSPLPQWGE